MKTFNFRAGTEIFDEENGSYTIINGKHFSDWDVTIVSPEFNEDGETIGEQRVNTFLTNYELKKVAGADALNFIEEE